MKKNSPFEFHTGFEAVPVGTNQMQMQCPFCLKDGHFYFNPDKDLWDCKVCQKSGNTYTFIQTLYDHCLKDVSALKKGIPRHILEKNGVRWNPFNETFVIPTYREGKMNNLIKYVERANTLYATPSLETTLFNWDEVTEEEIWLCEGHWDKMAAETMFGSEHPITAIGVPGANSFRDSWCGAFRDKDVVLMYDNDDAGKKGTLNVIEKFRNAPQKPRSLRAIVWPDDCPVGYDLRDHLLKYGRTAYREIAPWIVTVDEPEAVKVTVDNIIEDFSCDSYDKALDSFQTAFHTTDDMKKALALVLASIWSVKFDGLEQLWFKIIGPAGSGKTRIAKAVSASEQVVSRSTFTGLFSGWRDDNDSSDAGLIPTLSGKTLIVKDADALVKQPNAAQIFGELRDFYDKESSVQYRNRVKHDYKNVKSTIIICGTQVLRSADQSFLGERFLSIELDVPQETKSIISRKVMERSIAVASKQIIDPETKIMSSLKGYVNHLMQRDMESTIPQDFQELLLELCNLAALMRATVDRDMKRDIKSPPMAEMPTRIIGQIVAATLALCVVLGKSKADNDVFQIINKLIRDTVNPRSYRYRICRFILENPNSNGMDIKEALELNPRRFDNEIEDLIELGLLSVCKQPSMNRPGAKGYKFVLSNEIKQGLAELR
jgi:hypothetical protein